MGYCLAIYCYCILIGCLIYDEWDLWWCKWGRESGTREDGSSCSKFIASPCLPAAISSASPSIDWACMFCGILPIIIMNYCCYWLFMIWFRMSMFCIPVVPLKPETPPSSYRDYYWFLDSSIIIIQINIQLAKNATIAARTTKPPSAPPRFIVIHELLLLFAIIESC
jgi:hypothetical protein